jgi:polysaccharide biosynthesis protein PslG
MDEKPMKRFVGHGIWVVALVGMIVTTWLDNAWYRGVVTAPTAGVSEYAANATLGVNLFNVQFEPDPAVVERSFAETAKIGATVARIQMPWEDVEIHARGDFEDRRNPEHIRNAWEKYDHIVAMAEKHNISLIIRIDRPPLWARQQAAATEKFIVGLAENGDSTGPPDDYRDYANFVAAVVQRYPHVPYIQIWNEPNLAYEWNWQFPDPEAFTELLKLSAEAARRANPDVVILYPSLSPTDGKEPRIAPMSELDFLARSYRAGAADYFDIMSAQAYGLGQPPDEHRYVRLRWNPMRPFAELDRPIDSRIDVSRIVMLREVMEQAGDANTAVWVSEFGYNSAPESIPPERRFVWGPPVSEATKGEYVVMQLDRARREWPWLGVMNLWMLRWGGPPADPANPTPYFAIMAPDFTPYEGYAAIQKAATAPAVMSAGTHAWRHPAVRQIDDETWQVTFWGTGVGLRGQSDDVMVQLNDDEATYMPIGAGDASFYQGLPDATHTLTIRGLSHTPTAVLVWRDQPGRWLMALLPVVWVMLFGYGLWRVWRPNQKGMVTR